MTQFIKPYKSGYLHVMGNGKVRFWTTEELKIMSMAYDEMLWVAEQSRRSFSLDGKPIDEVFGCMKQRRKMKEDFEW